jgi:hypothetical protein
MFRYSLYQFDRKITLSLFLFNSSSSPIEKVQVKLVSVSGHKPPQKKQTAVMCQGRRQFPTRRLACILMYMIITYIIGRFDFLKNIIGRRR